jgi:hypothetical protein
MYLLIKVSTPGDFTPEPDVAIVNVTAEYKNFVATRRTCARDMIAQDPYFTAIQFSDDHLLFLEGIADTIDYKEWWQIDEEIARQGHIGKTKLPPFLKKMLEKNTHRSACEKASMVIGTDDVFWQSSYKSTQFVFKTVPVPIDIILGEEK